MIQAGQDVESIPSACRSLRPCVRIHGVGVSTATRVTYQRLTMSGKSYGARISWSCKHNKHAACSKLKCACHCHKLWNPARAKTGRRRLSALMRFNFSPRFHCNVAATTCPAHSSLRLRLVNQWRFAAVDLSERLVLVVVGWRHKDAARESFADCT